MTASPAKLRLMLIEAALKLALRTRELMANDRWKEAVETCVHCQEIITELMISPDEERGGELARQIKSLYLFIHKSLVTATIHRQPGQVDEALKILEIERETWRQVVGTIASSAPRMPHVSFDSATSTSISFEA